MVTPSTKAQFPLSALLILLMAACSSDFESGESSSETVVETMNGLAAPSFLTGEMQNGGYEVVLRWRDNSTVETAFRVELADTPMGSVYEVDEWTRVTANSTTHTFSTRPGLRYYARVYAVTDSLQSAPSNQVEIVTATGPPSVPPSLVAEGWSSSSIRLTWTDVSEESGYVIERASGPGGPWTSLPGTVDGDTTTYYDSGLSANTTYWYRVAATNVLGTSDYSNAAEGTTLAPNTSSALFPTPGEDDGYNTSIALDGASPYIAYYNASAVRTYVRGPGPLREIALGDGAVGTSVSVFAGTAHVATIAPNQLRRSSGTSSAGFTLVVVNPANGWNGLPRIIASNFGREYVGRSSQSGVSLLYWAEPAGGGSGGNFIASGYTNVHGLAFIKDPAGSLHIAYTASTNGGASFALYYGFKNVGSGIWNITSLPAFGRPTDVSIATERTGTGPTPFADIPHIVYYDSQGGVLYHVWRPNLLIGTGFQTQAIDAPAGRNVGAYNSMVLSGATLHVAYYDATKGDLRHAKRVGAGNPWQLSLLDAVGDVGSHTSIVASGSTIYVAYRDVSGQDLKLVTSSP